MTPLRSLRLGVALAGVLGAVSPSCIGLDGFLFAGKPVDAYRFEYSSAFPDRFRVPAALRDSREYRARDGTVVWVVTLRQPDPTAATASTVIYHHGQSENIDPYWERMGMLWGMGANVIAYDYPGYGKTPGTPTEASVFATARAATEYARSLAPTIDLARIYHYGFSMGSGPATYMTATTPAVRGLILEAPFLSIDALVADGSLVVPRSFVVTASFDNRSRIVAAARAALQGVLIFHGTRDAYVQTRHGDELDRAVADAETAGALPRGRHRLVHIEGAEHGNVPCSSVDDDPCTPRAMDHPYFVELGRFLTP